MTVNEMKATEARRPVSVYVWSVARHVLFNKTHINSRLFQGSTHLPIHCILLAKTFLREELALFFHGSMQN